MLAVAVPAMAEEVVENIDATVAENVEAVEAVEAIAVLDETIAAANEEDAAAPAAEEMAEEEGFDPVAALKTFAADSGIAKFKADEAIANDEDPMTNNYDWKCAIMLLIAFVLLFLAIVKKFEPLLLMPIAFGMLLTNLPGADMFHAGLFEGGHVNWEGRLGRGRVRDHSIYFVRCAQ